jgi:hypothetical protein
VAGSLSGAWLFVKVGQPPAAGALAGSFLAAAGFTLAALIVSFNPKIRRALLALVGSAAAIDAASRLALGPLAPGQGSFLKRLLVYLGAGTALRFLKAKPVLQRERAREIAARSAEAWLEAAGAVSAALIARLSSGSPGGLEAGQSRDERLLASLVPLARTLLAAPEGRGSAALAELARKLANHGYELEAAPKEAQRLAWAPELSSRYETFGLVRPGQIVVVEEEAVIKDGAVAAKGLVAPE